MSVNKNVSQRLPDYLEHLWRFSYHLSKSHYISQELTQKTCLRALEYQASYTGGNLKSWLFKIMHNLWRDELRYNHRLGLKLVSSETKEEECSTNEQPEQHVLLQEVLDLINQLPEAQRTTMLLTAVEGFTYRETAELLGIPLGTVMSRIARAREKIGKSVHNDHKSQTFEHPKERS
jgi:RNA polymerase sigma-70 factor (ECF subfamily)